MSIIQIKGLKKSYGKHVGVRDVSFSVEQGEIYGFVGPNGAGKSTTIKTLMGFIFPDGGTAFIKGLDASRESKAIKSFTGYVPSDVRLYSGMSVGELLRRNASFYKRGLTTETQRLCKLFEVDTGKRFSELSTGNKKKVSIVCALSPEPEVIILDEPTNGLDPIIQKSLFDELKRRTANGTTVLLSSHNLAEVQEYCRRVAFIRNGVILAVTDLSANIEVTKIVTLYGGNGATPPGFELLSTDGAERRFRTLAKGTALADALKHAAPQDFTVVNESIEERFWSLYGGKEQV